MFTLFSTPKAFAGEFARIQRNALRSWVALRPRPEILIFGDEEGTPEACAEFGLRHVRGIATSKTGAPVLSDLFQTAQRMAQHGVLCYVNADIILTQDLIRVIDLVDPQRWGSLVACAPVDMAMEEDLATDPPGWEQTLRARARRHGRYPSRWGADVFVFPRGYYDVIPPYLVGRGGWDNWLMAQARRDLKGIDATRCCLSIHQRHGGSTHTRDFDRTSQDHRLNLSLMRPGDDCRLRDLPYELGPDGALRRRATARQFLEPLKARVLGQASRLREKIGL